LVIARTTAAPLADPLDQHYYSKNDLGAVYSPRSTTLKIWAPTAKSVKVLVFADAVNTNCSTATMQQNVAGVWSATLEGDCDGKYIYTKSLTSKRLREHRPFTALTTPMRVVLRLTAAGA
jgi:pullulanase/glycogen debranching enzyme